jgi:hypothetical protein
MSRAFNPQREEMFQIKGDAPDPTGVGPERGFESRMKIGGAGRVGIAKVRYRDRITEADVYKVDGEPYRVVLYCPRCEKVLTIPGDRKQIDWTPPAPGHEAEGGVLSVERFRCTWELGDQQTLGAELCRLTLAIDRNVARDA